MDREALFRRLDDYCRMRFLELGQRQLKKPVLKSYVVETRRDMLGGPIRTFGDLGDVVQEDEDLYSVTDRQGPVGFVERKSRFLIFHTLLKTSDVEPAVLRMTRGSLLTDSLWLSGDILGFLFDVARANFSGRRFSRVAMEFEPSFEVFPEDGLPSEHEDSEIEDEDNSRPLNRFGLSNRLEKLDNYLRVLRNATDFRSITMLRFPSPTTSGGYEFYFYGKVTNRSDGFYGHRDVLDDVLDGYLTLTEWIEDRTWFGGIKDRSPQGIEAVIEGAPVVFGFREPLATPVFHSFLDTTFRKMRGPFRLIGNLIPAGRERFHVYGLDMHLGQRIFLDLSPRAFVAILPHGTCGNTVHRLAANIQRHLSQNVDITVGGSVYSELIKEAFTVGARQAH